MYNLDIYFGYIRSRNLTEKHYASSLSNSLEKTPW